MRFAVVLGAAHLAELDVLRECGSCQPLSRFTNRVHRRRSDGAFRRVLVGGNGELHLIAGRQRRHLILIAERNVERQSADPASVLTFYRSLLRLRRTSPALLSGGFEAVESNRGLLAYIRTGGEQRAIVVLNFTAEAQELTLSQVAPSATVLLGSHRPAGEHVDGRPLRLRPLESVVLQP